LDPDPASFVIVDANKKLPQKTYLNKVFLLITF
jgi:hypothetical protein